MMLGLGHASIANAGVLRGPFALAALACGMGVAALGIVRTRHLARCRRATPDIINDADLVGEIGHVVVPIHPHGPGLVALTVRGRRIQMPALAHDRRVIPANTRVQVLYQRRGIAMVRLSP